MESRRNTNISKSQRGRGSVVGVIAIIMFLALTIPFGRSGNKILKGFPSSVRMEHLPKIMLWAWERPEDLNSINPKEVGVAYLAKTFCLRGNRLGSRPRLQPLRIPPGTSLIPVVRIESDRFNPPIFSNDQRRNMVSEMVELIEKSKIKGIQLDFDSKASERDFYRGLLFELRRALPGSTWLSITALASWCIYDEWLEGLPVNEAVPMLFRMGPDHHRVLAYLKAGRGFRPITAQSSLGISTDEPIPNFLGGKRIYIFSPHAWKPETTQEIIKEVKQWQ